jgi:hypothetical protein
MGKPKETVEQVNEEPEELAAMRAMSPEAADERGRAAGEGRAPSTSCPTHFVAPMRPGNLEVHWPEGEVPIDRRRRSPQAGIPDYNAIVRAAAHLAEGFPLAGGPSPRQGLGI